MNWWQQLDKTAGSRPRCVSLASGSRTDVAERLTKLVAQPDVVVTTDSCWMPKCLPVQKPDGSWDVSAADEARLDKPNDLLAGHESEILRNWWLAHTDKANTPNWDLASTCRVGKTNGILLVEAKAHAGELAGEEKGKKLDGDASRRSYANHLKIGQAISDAAACFQRSTGQPCAISRDRCYQMSNRVAMACKLTEMGYAVVLVYLGFLNTREMGGRGLLTSQEQWTDLVTKHSKMILPVEFWGREWKLNNQSFIPLIRSLEWSFK